MHTGSRDSVVGIATRYRLGGPGIETRWGEIFCTYPDWLRGPPSLLYNGYRVYHRVKDGRGVMLTTHPLLVPRLRESWAIPPLSLWVLLGLLQGSLYIYYIRTQLLACSVCADLHVVWRLHTLPAYNGTLLFTQIACHFTVITAAGHTSLYNINHKHTHEIVIKMAQYITVITYIQ
jgi:hypothetical protein